MRTSTAALQGIVAEHIAAVNAFDENAIVATFAEDALVNDAHREFWGADAIRRWVAKEIVGDKVTVEVTEVIDHHGEILRSRRDGLLALILPLGLDTFAMAAALGMVSCRAASPVAHLGPVHRVRGRNAAGRARARSTARMCPGRSRDYVAIGVLLAFGLYMLLGEDNEEERLVTQLGLRLGSRLSGRLREGAESLAGAALIGLGLVLLG